MDKNYYFIVNTHSKTGKAKELWNQLEEILQQQKVTYQAYITEYVHHATEIAGQLTAGDNHIYLVVCGGDGTVNEALNGIRDLSKVTLGYIPLGSANDFARGLHITGSPEEILLAMLKSERETSIDIGLVKWQDGQRRFVISAGAGIDAMVCRQVLTSKLKKFLNQLHLGKLTYGLLTVADLFRSPFVNAKARTMEGAEFDMPHTIFTAAMNFSCEGGGVPMAPKASAEDGMLSVCCVSGIPRLLCLFCFPFLLAAKHEGIKGFEVVNTKELQITFDKPMVVHADGEDCGDQTEVTFVCVPEALKIPDLKYRITEEKGYYETNQRE